MKTRTEVIAALRDKLRLRHYALTTERAYCWWVGRYYDHCLRLPKDMDPERKAESFLSDLAVKRGVAAKTQNQAMAALLFLYGSVLRRPLGNIESLRAKRPHHERVAPSREQVAALRQAIRDSENTPARLLVDLLYGCGLRVSEPLELRIKDILWEENQLVIRGAKGGKDRRVPIPKACDEPLRAQVRRAKAIWEADRASPDKVGVALPFQYEKKSPTAASAWQWFWVFPAPGYCKDPRSGIWVRYHLLPDSLQRAVRDAAIKVGLDNFVTPHVLRHAYATHSRESIEALRVLMGHSSITTTSGYRHADVERASNPLDDMADTKT